MKLTVALLFFCLGDAHCKIDWDKYDKASTWWRDYAVKPKDLLEKPGLLYPQQDDEGSVNKRRLQQDLFDVPEVAPFTFDGFPMGLGGLIAPDSGLSPYTAYINNILVRNLFNGGLGQYISQGLGNSVDLYRYLPRDVQDLVDDDVVTLFGYDVADRYIGQYLTLPSAEVGDRIPGGCIGPIYSLKVDGGTCEVQDDGTVECSQPTISFRSTPLVCNLPYRAACSLEGLSFRFTESFGRERSGELGPPAGVYNFGASMNVTRLYLGYNRATRRVLNDFGVQNWYNFLSNFIQLELLRVRTAIVEGTVGDNGGGGDAAARASSEGEQALRAGVQDAQAAGAALLKKVGARLGLDPNLTPEELLQTLTKNPNPKKRSPKGQRVSAVTQEAQARAAADDPFIALKQAGAPLSGEGLQDYVSNTLAGTRTASTNPYTLQQRYVTGSSDNTVLKGLVQKAEAEKRKKEARSLGPQGGAAAGQDASKPDAAATDMGIGLTASAERDPGETLEQLASAAEQVIQGGLAGAAPLLQQAARGAPGIEVNASLVEEGKSALLTQP